MQDQRRGRTWRRNLGEHHHSGSYRGRSLHQIRVELVTVGDLVLDARLLAVVASVREALVNAGKHAGVAEVSCYIEVTNCEVVAYVRDRGQGFDQDAVEPDRHGISRSIRGRMIRVGGSVEIESTSGEGTEVRLLLPLPGRTEATTP